MLRIPEIPRPSTFPAARHAARLAAALTMTMTVVGVGLAGAQTAEASRPMPSVVGSVNVEIVPGVSGCFAHMEATLTDVRGRGTVTFSDGVNPTSASFSPNQTVVSATIVRSTTAAPVADVTITVTKKNGTVVATGIVTVNCAAAAL